MSIALTKSAAIRDKLRKRIVEHSWISEGEVNAAVQAAHHALLDRYPRELVLELSQNICDAVADLQDLRFSGEAVDVTQFSQYIFPAFRRLVGMPSETSWPCSEPFKDAVVEQWTQEAARIAGRWLQEQLISGERLKANPESAVAIRLAWALKRTAIAFAEAEQHLREDELKLLAAGVVRASHAVKPSTERLSEAVTEVIGGLGDPHCGHHTVLRIDFTEGRRVIYRPRAMDSDAAMMQITDRLGFPRAPRCITSADHGWSEYITDVEESERPAVAYWHAAGQWLALGHVLAGTDFHFGNFLAAEGLPTLIDMETLFQPELGLWETQNEQRFNQTVLRVGLLPHRIGKGADSVETGLIRQRTAKGAKFPFPVPRVTVGKDGKRRFEMVSTMPEEDPAGLYMDRDDATVDEVRLAVRQGFDAGIRALADSSDTVERIVAEHSQIRSRVILTPTYRYAHVRNVATNPHIVDDPELVAWANAQILLWGDKQLWEAEMRALAEDDYPAFSVARDSMEIRSLDGSALGSAPLGVGDKAEADSAHAKIVRSPAAVVQYNLRALRAKSEGELEQAVADQLKWIDASFIGRYQQNRFNAPEEYASTIGTPLELLEQVADFLVQRAGYNPESIFGTDFLASTVGEDFDRNWQPGASSDQFYGGAAGSLYFLACLVSAADQGRIPTETCDVTAVRELLERAVSSLGEQFGGTGGMPLVVPWEHTPSGWSSGTMGQLLALAQCRASATPPSDEAIPNLISQAARDLRDNWAGLSEEEIAELTVSDLEVINGLAGNIRVLSCLAEAGGKKDYPNISSAIAAGTQVLETWLSLQPWNDDDFCGYAHGLAGIVDTYLGVGGNPHIARPAVQHIVDFLQRSEPDSIAAGWCHGATGYGLLAVTLMRSVDTELRTSAQQVLQLIAPELLKERDHLGLSACHGSIGVLEAVALLEEASADTGVELPWEPGWLMAAQRDLVEKTLPADMAGANTKETFSGSLMCGMAGIGQYLLGLSTDGFADALGEEATSGVTNFLGRAPRLVAAPWHG